MNSRMNERFLFDQLVGKVFETNVPKRSIPSAQWRRIVSGLSETTHESFPMGPFWLKSGLLFWTLAAVRSGTVQALETGPIDDETLRAYCAMVKNERFYKQYNLDTSCVLKVAVFNAKVRKNNSFSCGFSEEAF